MRRSLGYADAVRLLGGKSPALELLDHLTRGALLAASGGASEALSLFDARSEAVRLGADLLGPLRDRMRGLSRYSRTERLEAAHAVLVVAAYFEALNEAELPFDPRRLDLTRADQISLATGEKNHHPRRPMLGGTLPTPLRPAGSTEAALRTFYADLSINLLALAECLKVWDDLDAAGRLTLASAFTELPERAIGRYREHLRRLATDFPELASGSTASTTRRPARSWPSSGPGSRGSRRSCGRCRPGGRRTRAGPRSRGRTRPSWTGRSCAAGVCPTGCGCRRSARATSTRGSRRATTGPGCRRPRVTIFRPC